MIRTGTVFVAFALALFVLSPRVAASGGHAEGSRPPRIVNHVLHLLDHTVSLEGDTDHDTWESVAFDTAQFDTAVLKVDSHATSGVIQCEIAWQVGPNDTFLNPVPTLVDSIFSIRYPLDFEVHGTAGKVFCRAVATSDPRGGGVSPGAGTVTDVKLLLRRK